MAKNSVCWLLPVIFFLCCSCSGQEAPKPFSSVAVQVAATRPQAQATPQPNSPCPPLAVHAGDFTDTLAFSPDGQWLATAANNSWLKPNDNPTHVAIWNTLTGNLLRKWDTKYPVIEVVFSPDGEHLATVDQKGTVQVVDYRTGQDLYASRGGNLAYTADGKMWAATVYRALPKSKSRPAKGYSTIEVHEAATGKLLRTIDADGWVNIYALAVTQDELVLAAGCTSEDDDCEGSIQGWELASGKPVKDYRVEGGVFSPDGHWVTQIDAASHKLKLFDLSNGEVKANIPLRDNRTPSVAAFSADGRTIALAQYSQDRPGNYVIVIDLWSVPAGSKIATLQTPPGDYGNNQGIQVIPNTSPSGLHAVVFSPDGKRLAAANYFIETTKDITCPSYRSVARTWYSLLRIWDVTTGREVLTLGGQTPQ